MKKYKAIERDVVIDGIYCDYIYDNEEKTYYLMTSFDGKYVTMALGDDKHSSQSTFYFFSMEFCTVFDTYGKEEFIKWVNKYKDVKSIKMIRHNDFDDNIEIINV